MGTSEGNRDQNGSAEALRGASSQAGLSSYVGGRIKSLPSVPSPGQPGSRFNPVVVSREEQAARGRDVVVVPHRSAAAAKSVSRKSLDIGAAPGIIKAIPPEVMNPHGTGPTLDPVEELADPGVISAAVGGFAGGFATGAQEALYGTDVVQDVKEAGTPEAAVPCKKVVMNPAHLARLETLDGRRNDSLENVGGHFGR